MCTLEMVLDVLGKHDFPESLLTKQEHLKVDSDQI